MTTRTQPDANTAEVRRRAARQFQQHINRVARKVERHAEMLDDYRRQEQAKVLGYTPAELYPEARPRRTT